MVVFWDPEGARWPWLLKPGFRHVFCCVEADGYWVMFDARDGRPAVQVVADAGFDLAGFYRAKDGYTVVETEQSPGPVPWPLVVRNCVGLVKALLCIRSAALTPWQLHRHLTRTKR